MDVSKLKNIEFGSHVTSIAALGRVTGLTGVTIPSSVSSIAEWAFACGLIPKSQFINNSNLSSDDYWSARVYESLVSNMYILGTKLAGVVPTATSVTIPDTITEIGKFAFLGSSISSLVIPEGVTTLDENAFDGMSLTSLVLPSTLTRIKSDIFQNSTVSELTCYAIEPPTCDSNAFEYGTFNKIHVLRGSVDAYKSADGWSKYSDLIDEISLPSEYEALEYLESTGTQWIDTGDSPSPNSKYYLNFDIQSKSGNGILSPMGSRSSSYTANKDASCIWIHESGMDFDWISGSFDFSPLSGIELNTKYKFIGFESGFILNGASYSTDVESHYISTKSSDNIYLFTSNDQASSVQYPMSGRIYEYAVVTSGKLVRYMTPAKRTSDGELGMYDLVGNNFYVNAGTGSFKEPSIQQNNVIFYEASSKLAEASFINNYKGLHPNSFGSKMTSHEFSNGKGVITFDGDVTEVGDNAFNGCTSLTSITIPNSVTSIGSYAFNNCSGLTSITIPDSVTFIGSDTFTGCTSLTSITIPDSVTSISNHTFNGCTNLTSVTIPDSVTSIGISAFTGCRNLTDITIPNSVTSISTSTFNRCSSLTSITIPDSVTSIGGSAFYGCSSLTSITIPDSVTSIGSKAFYTCSKLTSINLPSSVTSIGSNAFSYCVSLSSITIPDSVISISSGAFSGCSNLTSITIPNSVTSISNSTFSRCSSLVSVTILGPIRNIGNEAFYICNNLTSINLPSSVTSIGDSAFLNCENLTSITIPDSVRSIGISAFSGCSNLTSITIPSLVTSIGSNTFNRCSSLSSITLPDSVTSIGSSAFSNCVSLSSITIPNSVTSIGVNAFNSCSSLISVTIPNSIPRIESYAFYGCSKLTSITIPSSVTFIGDYAFYDCYKLNVMTFNPVSPPALGELPIPTNTNVIYVPSTSVDTYKSASGWSAYADKIQAIS